MREGKLVSLAFALRMPVDQTKVYDTAITMFELEVGSTVTLNSDQVRNLMRDEWDWTEDFYASNSAYSDGATRMAEELGY